MSGSARARVVVVGSGFGGLRAARALRDAPVDVTLIDRNNYHLFQPLLYQVATAGLGPEDITRPVRAIFRGQRNLVFRMAEVTGIDLEHRAVLCGDRSFPYDYLILAPGGETEFFGKLGAARVALGLKDVAEAVAIRNRVLRAFERAEAEEDPAIRRGLLTIVVVGGGPTGVEMAGALSELTRLVLSEDHPRLEARDLRIVLIEAGKRLLHMLPADLSEAAKRSLERKGVEVDLGRLVQDVDEGGIVLDGGERIATRTVIWAAGVRAVGLVAVLARPPARQGRIPVTPTLQVPDHPEIYAIGDAAWLEQDGEPLPMLAPVAMQMAERAASNIRLELQQQTPQPFRYEDKGTLATIGRNSGVAFVHGIKFRGALAWWVWLVVHIFQLIGFRNRLVVLVNWAWNYVFYDPGARTIGPE